MVTLDKSLKKVWVVVGQAVLEQVLGAAEARARHGGAGALDEDVWLTALFLWTLQSTHETNALQVNAEEAALDDDDVEGEDNEDERGLPWLRGERRNWLALRRPSTWCAASPSRLAPPCLAGNAA